MDRYITKSKYFSTDFNTAIFSDPIRIYFSNEQEAEALELYFKLQSRKNQWEKFLRTRGPSNYCYILLYRTAEEFGLRFNNTYDYAPGEMGEDFVLGINGPMTPQKIESFLSSMDDQIGYASTPTE